jgi:hypothetical protein
MPRQKSVQIQEANNTNFKMASFNLCFFLIILLYLSKYDNYIYLLKIKILLFFPTKISKKKRNYKFTYQYNILTFQLHSKTLSTLYVYAMLLTLKMPSYKKKSNDIDYELVYVYLHIVKIRVRKKS